jgi:hypothetical protein
VEAWWGSCIGDVSVYWYHFVELKALKSNGTKYLRDDEKGMEVASLNELLHIWA